MDRVFKKDEVSSFSITGTKKCGLLLIHGFTSTTQSMSLLARAFADAGCHVECPLLSGHGSKWEDMKKISFQDWEDDVRLAYARLSKRAEKVFVLGLSMGGTLALRLAETHRGIQGLILINHALLFGNPAVHLAGVLQYVLPAVPAISGDLADPDAEELAYDRVSTHAVYELYKMTLLARKKIVEVKAPVLMFKSKQDHVLPRKNVSYTMKRLMVTDKELIWLERSYHVATLDYDHGLIADKTLEFIKKRGAMS